MAQSTVLADRRMLPQIRAALFSVALVTGIVECLSGKCRCNRVTVKAVASAAIHLSLKKRMRERLACLGALQLMTIEANVRLGRSLQHGIARRMAGMAIAAGNLVNVVRPAVPAQSDLAVVAIHTHAILRPDAGFVVGVE